MPAHTEFRFHQNSVILDTWQCCVARARQQGFKIMQIARYAECTPRLVRLVTPTSRQGLYRSNSRARERFVLRAIGHIAALAEFGEYASLVEAFTPAIALYRDYGPAERPPIPGDSCDFDTTEPPPRTTASPCASADG